MHCEMCQPEASNLGWIVAFIMNNQNMRAKPNTADAERAVRPLETGRTAAPSVFPRWKYRFDLAFIVLTLPFWLPLMLCLGLLIFCLDPGPILFRQQRIGYRGKPFTCLKFRTMKTGAEPGAHEALLDRLIGAEAPMTKLDNLGDPRLIPLARILRASGLDELPQLFNVLRGEMSLVGPRPCTPFEYERYTPAQRGRSNVPPGLTGYWQVNGKNTTTFAQMIEMDLHYANHFSPWMDLSILFRTIPALLAQVSALQAPADNSTIE